jgi:type IV pilus assembly protein PilP
MKNVLSLFLMVVLCVLVAGCNKQQTPEKKPMAEKVQPAEVKKETVQTAEAQKIVQEEYKYDAKGRRDPFVSLVVITKQKSAKKKGASPFESYDLNEIKLLAIAWDKNKYFALIQLPDKKTYTITEKMSLGLQGGKVEKITNDSVVIREQVKDYRGDMKQKDTILKLHKGEE